MCIYIFFFVPTNTSACLYSGTSQTKSSWWRLSRHPRLLLPSRVWWERRACLAARWSRVSGRRRPTERGGTGRSRLAACAIRAGQTGGTAAHPAEVGDWSRISQREKTQVSTVRMKNKLHNGWIPVFCSSGTVRSCCALAVAHGRLSHSWKRGLRDA